MKRGFDDDGAARPHERDSSSKAVWLAGRVDGDVERAGERRTRGIRGARLEAERRRHRSAGLAAHHHRHPRAVRAKNLRHEQSKPARAHDRRARAGLDLHLLDDPAGRGGRLHEHRRHIVERRRNRVKVGRRKREVLGERAVAAANAGDRAHAAVSASRRAAGGAPSAADGDLAHDALTDPRGISRARRLDDADELVARHAREARVAAEQLEVGAADAGRRHADHALIAGGWFRTLPQRERPIDVEHEGTHETRLARKDAACDLLQYPSHWRNQP